ncbi:Peptidase M20 [Carpediemonas membranifera]|uniref:Peptidase M20 n=1 Tax=Carpediemonas membranifera TaxID=201153 RepID=A0A8J6BA60_9EUKA|nr:Peptidase M20 [Carpediemonas membranifera]|eukprot:KAG9396464.1 Peptidase M20 [Carpediemonas membranifera]
MKLTTAAAQAVFDELKTIDKDHTSVWEAFLAVLEIPRPSYHLEKITAFLKTFSDEHAFEFRMDNAQNVCITVPASPGCEQAPSVALQGHSDIVGIAKAGTKHSFPDDPIVPQLIDDGADKFITATNTSLGADNGIAIALAIALSTDKTLKHGPLELLITANEEVGLVGAKAVEADFIKSALLINLDSEEENNLCVGCAGAFVNNIALDISREALPAGHVTLDVEVTNLSGGHGGADIHLGRACAIKTITRMLMACLPAGGRLVAMSGGTAHNAIPRDAKATVTLPMDDVVQFKADMTRLIEIIKEENRRTDPNIQLSINEITNEEIVPMTVQSTSSVLHFTALMPIRPVKMSQDVDGLVSSSYATTIIETTDAQVKLNGTARSETIGQLDAIYDQISGLCALAGAAAPERENEYPGWPTNSASELLKITKEEHATLVGAEPTVTAVHAGLECGILMSHCPITDAISIGPEIQSPHSPFERMKVSSVGPVYDVVAAVLARLAVGK